jgi:hypothetical protein
MELDVRPEPSEQERAAIAAALAQEAEDAAAAWPQSVFPQHDDSDGP